MAYNQLDNWWSNGCKQLQKKGIYYTGSSQDDLNVSQSNDLKAVMLLLFVFILQFLLLKLLKVNLLEGFYYDNFS